MLAHRTMLVSFFCAGLATIAGALPQVYQHPIYNPGPSWIAFTGGSPSAAFRQTLAADFNSDGWADVIVQRDTDLEMLFGPAYFAVHLGPFAGGVNDFAVLPGSNPPQLITVGSDGLFQLQWDEHDNDPSYWRSTPIETDHWKNVRNIVIDSRPGVLRYFGVKYDNLSGISTVQRLDPADPSHTDEIFTLPSLVRDLQLVQFDETDLTPELALMTGNKVIVYPAYGASYAPLRTTTTYPSHAFTPVHKVGSTVERIQWFNHAPGTTNESLVSLFPSATLDTTQISFAGLSPQPGIVACARGNGDADTREDLLYSQTSAQSLVILHQVLDAQTGEPRFNLSSSTLVPYGEGGSNLPALTNKAQPAWADMDNDGDLDICFPIQEGSKMFIQPGDWSVSSAAPYIEAPVNDLPAGTVSPSSVTFFNVKSPAVAEADDIEVLIWQRASNSVPTDPHYAAPQQVPGQNAPAGMQLTVTLPNTSPNPVYFLLMRWIPRTPGAARFPARLYAVQLGGWGAAYLQSLAVSGPWPLNYGGFTGPTVCEIARIPDLAPDDPPRPNQ